MFRLWETRDQARPLFLSDDWGERTKLRLDTQLAVRISKEPIKQTQTNGCPEVIVGAAVVSLIAEMASGAVIGIRRVLGRTRIR